MLQIVSEVQLDLLYPGAMIAPGSIPVILRSQLVPDSLKAAYFVMCLIIINHIDFFLVHSINESNYRGDFVASSSSQGTF